LSVVSSFFHSSLVSSLSCRVDPSDLSCLVLQFLDIVLPTFCRSLSVCLLSWLFNILYIFWPFSVLRDFYFLLSSILTIFSVLSFRVSQGLSCRSYDNFFQSWPSTTYVPRILYIVLHFRSGLSILLLWCRPSVFLYSNFLFFLPLLLSSTSAGLWSESVSAPGYVLALLTLFV